jgi:CHAT domain-containing protein
MRLRAWIVAAVSSLVLAAAPPAQAGDPDLDDLTASLDQAEASLDEAWLGWLVETYGEYDEALAAKDGALASAAKLPGEERALATARVHAMVARAWLEKGELARASQAYGDVLAAAASSPRAQRELGYAARVGLGRVALASGDLTASQARFEEAGAFLEQHGMGQTRAALPHLVGLGRARLAAGDRRGAAEALGQAQAIAGAAGDVEVLRAEALLRIASGDLKAAQETVERLFALGDRSQAMREIATMPMERHSLGARASLEDDLRLALSLARLARDAGSARFALQALLRRKGLVLEAMAARQAAFVRRAAEDPKLAERMKQRAALEAELAELLRVPPAPGEQAARAHRVAELEKSIDMQLGAMSLHLTPGSGAEGTVAQSLRITVEGVQAVLAEDAALVEFARYAPVQADARRELDRWGAPRYAAIVLRHAGAPVFVDLGEARAIDDLALDFRRALGDKRADAKDLGRSLALRLLLPLEARLAGARRLWLSPDGALDTVPFEALVDASGHFLVERFGTTYLGSGRELVAPRAPSRDPGPPLLIADPAFEEHMAPSGAASSRGLDLRKAHFDPLPGTTAEANGIRAAFPEAVLLSGKAATREALLGASHPRLLHVATHGFFVPAEKARARDGTLDPGRDNPLLRAGLALSGANGGEGVLWALELATVDLTGTRLSVLSACETGLGDVRDGEGVFGLRRALAIAGAETQVISLWQVDDEATLAMMVAYYGKLRAGGGRSEAMREVRLSMLGRPATAHPYFWASFVVSGDATSLDGKDVPPSAPAPEPASVPRVAPGARGCGCTSAPSSTEFGGIVSMLLALALARRTSRARHGFGPGA